MSEIPKFLRERMAAKEEMVSRATEAMKERRSQEMRDNSDYQRKQRLGEDGRIREAIDIQAKHIHERNQYADSCPTYSEARKQAEANAEKMVRKRDG